MTAIAKPPDSLYDTAPDELVPVLESMVQAVQASANWKTRKKTLMEALMVVETMTALNTHQKEIFEGLVKGIEDGSLSEEEAKEAISAISATDDAESDEKPDAIPLTEILPIFIGAILERLDEPEIVCAEQVAFYLLSAHPEHFEAAEAWLQADFKNSKAFKKLLRADRRYAGLFELIIDTSNTEGERDPAKGEENANKG